MTGPPVAVEVTRLHWLDEEAIRGVARLLQRLVAEGAALGWIEPPPDPEVAALLRELVTDADRDDAHVVVAYYDGRLTGFGCWRRYTRPTHRPHADLQKVAVDPACQGRGVGRQMMNALIDAATASGVEVLTLDLRGDNTAAVTLYESLGFVRYGTLERFVAVGPERYDKLFYARDLRSTSR